MPKRGKYDRSQTARERKDEQREKLLEAATEVFAQRGYAGATVEAVIKKTGMSRRTFYEHFDDLRDLLNRVHDRAAALAFEFITAQTAEVKDPLARIRVGLEAFLGAIATRGDVARIVFREVRSAGPEWESRRELETTRYAATMMEAVAEAHAKGTLSRAPDEVTCYALATAVEGIAMRYLARGAEAHALEAVEPMFQLIIRAFR
jgi:AcrR family transcriptional regulator